MARITVEDCIDKFPSRFELVLVAANRARKLYAGETSNIEKDNDKNTVIALREIADETLSVEQLKNDLIEEYQTVTFNDEEEIEDLSDKDIDSNESEKNPIENLTNDDATIEDNISSNEESLIQDEANANSSHELTDDNSQKKLDNSENI